MNENFKIFWRVYVIVDDTVISGVNAEVLEADPVDADDIARTGMAHIFFFRFQIQYVPCFRYDDIQREKDGIKKDGEEADNLWEKEIGFFVLLSCPWRGNTIFYLHIHITG